MSMSMEDGDTIVCRAVKAETIACNQLIITSSDGRPRGSVRADDDGDVLVVLTDMKNRPRISCTLLVNGLAAITMLRPDGTIAYGLTVDASGKFAGYHDPPLHENRPPPQQPGEEHEITRE